MKCELTLRIEKKLSVYSPEKIGDIKINKDRANFIGYEVLVESGETKSGIIDAVTINEYFSDLTDKRVCRLKYMKKIFSCMHLVDCPLGIKNREDIPVECNNTNCEWNQVRLLGVPKILIQCYEIKVSKSDFKSKNGHNFVGNLNYYVMPSELYKEVSGDIPSDIGVIVYSNGSLRRRKNAQFKEMSDEEQKWIILNVLKRQKNRFVITDKIEEVKK